MKSKSKTLRDSWLEGTIPSLDHTIPMQVAREKLESWSEDGVRTEAKIITMIAEKYYSKILEKLDIGDVGGKSATIIGLYEKFAMALTTIDGLRKEGIVSSSFQESLAVMMLQEAAKDNLVEAYKFCVIFFMGKEIYEKTKREMYEEKNLQYINVGKKVSDNVKLARDVSAEVRGQISRDNKRQWRTMAIEKWPDVPGWSVMAMSQWIKKETGIERSASTIKDELKGIKSTLFKSS